MPIYDRQPNEPARWYARFEIYRSLGPSRTLEAAFRACAAIEKLSGSRPGQAWYAAAKQYNWQERADAYDAEQREKLRRIEEDRRFDAREQRLSKIDELLAAAYNVLSAARLGELSDPEEARAWLPQIRLLFRDLLNAQRIELGLPTVTQQDTAGGISITADDLIAAQEELRRWHDHHQPRANGHHRGHLLALRNALATLYPDEASARRIASSAGLTLSRIKFSHIALDSWHAILTEAENTGQIEELITVVTSEYGANRELRQAIHRYRSNA